ncbi:hypothetical protein GGR56DRAFT_315635 [Xylariaceae sp. FL0804]|nr:hypothetical protein GGR56DRAFT_315635 [Xylariaceae sp. FL0804]
MLFIELVQINAFLRLQTCLPLGRNLPKAPIPLRWGFLFPGVWRMNTYEFTTTRRGQPASCPTRGKNTRSWRADAARDRLAGRRSFPHLASAGERGRAFFVPSYQRHGSLALLRARAPVGRSNAGSIPDVATEPGMPVLYLGDSYKNRRVPPACSRREIVNRNNTNKTTATLSTSRSCSSKAGFARDRQISSARSSLRTDQPT